MCIPRHHICTSRFRGGELERGTGILARVREELFSVHDGVAGVAVGIRANQSVSQEILRQEEDRVFRMPRISRRDVKAGMVLAEDVNNPRGQLLIAAGTVLTEKHISALQLWGVSFLHIEGPEGEESTDTAPLISEEALMRAKEQAVAAYQHNKDRLAHPFLKCLVQQSIIRFATENPGECGETLHGAHEPGGAETGETRVRTAEDMVKRVGTLGSLPSIYQEIIQVVNHPLSSATDVANVISKDVGLTARLLRIVNSAFYGFPGKIETVSRATAIVGTNELCELALATAVMSVFDRSLRNVVTMSQFWLHCLFCGSVARMLGKLRGGANSERFFVIGLLHDIGRLVMFLEAPRLSREVLEEAARSGRPVYEVERAMFGFTHAAAGRELLAAWNLPQTHQEAVRHHHVPLENRELTPDIAIAHIAEVIANAMRVGRSGDSAVPPVTVEAWEYLNLSTDVLREVIEDADTHVHDLATIFGVEEL